MDIFSLRRGRMRLALACFLLVPGAVALSTVGVTADGGAVKVDQQAYNWDESPSPDPYATAGDGELHAAAANGSTAAHALIHVDFGSLPQGAQINELILTLQEDPNDQFDTSSNADQTPGLKACVLTQPFTAQNTGASYDCTKYPTAVGDFDSVKNTWTFNLQPLAASWDRLGNTGAAIVPRILAPGGSGVSNVPNNDVNWSLSFKQGGTKATVNYTPGGAGSYSSAPGPSTAFSGGLSIAPPAPVTIPPPPKAAPAPAPAAAPPPAQQAAPAGVAPLSKIETQKVWIGIAAGLALLALLLVVGGAGLQLLRAGTFSLPAVGGALAAAWPQVATPAAVVLAGAVIAGGFSGRVVTIAGPGSSGAAAYGGSAGAAGANGAALPGTAGSSLTGAAGASGGAFGAAGSAASSGSGSGSLPVGVTPTTVRIGFFHASNVNTINQANGINGLNNVGNGDAQANAMVDWINKHGGIAGHRIQPVFVPEDASNQDPTYGQQLCTTMTEDEQVFAVIDDNNENTQTLQCYYQHHTLVFNTGLSLFSEAQIRAWNPYVWITENPSLDRDMVEKLNALQQRGFFTAPDVTTKIRPGFAYPNDPDTIKVVNNLVIPYMHQLGFADGQYDNIAIDVSSGNTGAVLAQINNAALKMDTDNVNRVFFVNDSGAAIYAFFGRDADNERYTPRYGLSSQDGLDATGYLIPEDQKVNSIAVGYWPWADTSQVNSMGFPDSQSEALCYQIMNQHGIYSAESKGHERDGEGILTMEWRCDALWTLYYASANLGQNLNDANVAAGIVRLGNSFQLSISYPNYTYFGPRNPDPVDYYRYIKFDPNCTTGYDGGTGSPPQGCFKYDGTASYRSPEV